MYNRSVARRVMKNDPDAFRILYDDWAEQIYAMAYDMLGDTLLAKSAAAECFFRAWKQTGDLKDDKQLSQWLVAIAKQTCSEVAFSRRELSETDKEEVWKETALRAKIDILEWDPIVESSFRPDTGEFSVTEEDWKPLIFLPDEEEHALPVAETKEPAVEQEAEKPEKPKGRRKKDKEDTEKTSNKANKLLAASLAVIAIVLLGGAVLLGLASTGVIRLPETLSGAANAIWTWWSAVAG